VWSLKGVERVLYRLPEVVGARLSGGMTLICEGEKDADRAASLGFAATTCAEGAEKWRDHYNPELRGANVVLLPHNDPAGRAHMVQVAASLAPVAKTIRLLELPGVGERGDLADWVEDGGTREELERLIEEWDLFKSDTYTPVVR
jgi:putative DNA primase/helicase